jgi:hypothetical protein
MFILDVHKTSLWDLTRYPSLIHHICQYMEPESHVIFHQIELQINLFMKRGLRWSDMLTDPQDYKYPSRQERAARRLALITNKT